MHKDPVFKADDDGDRDIHQTHDEHKVCRTDSGEVRSTCWHLSEPPRHGKEGVGGRARRSGDKGTFASSSCSEDMLVNYDSIISSWTMT